MSAHAARRLLAMAENTACVIGIELLVAAQECDFHAPLTSSPPLEAVRALLRAEVAHLEEDRYLASDIAQSVGLLRSGRLIRTAGEALLSGVV